MTPDGSPTQPEEPSPLHRTLRWSLPGAALLSVPAGIAIQGYFWPGLTMLVSISGDVLRAVSGGVSLLAAIAICTSPRAIIHSANVGGPPLLVVFILLFNLLAIIAGCLGLWLAIPWFLYSFGYYA